MEKFFCKIIYDGKDSRDWQGNGFIIRQKKNNHGLFLEKMYLYTQNRGGGDYYNTTAFAVFSQAFHLEMFMNLKLEKKEI